MPPTQWLIKRVVVYLVQEGEKGAEVMVPFPGNVAQEVLTSEALTHVARTLGLPVGEDEEVATAAVGKPEEEPT